MQQKGNNQCYFRQNGCTEELKLDNLCLSYKNSKVSDQRMIKIWFTWLC